MLHAAGNASQDVLPDSALSGQAISLAQTLFPGAPHASAHGDVRVWQETPFPEGSVDGCRVTITHLSMSTHIGTHVDVPRHFFADGKTVDEYALERFIRPAVVASVAREGIVAVTAAELETALPEVHPGDTVLLSFGYANRFRKREYLSHPYLSDDAAEYLVSLRIGALGVDVMTPDMPTHHRPPNFQFPVHRTLLSNDVLIFENLGAGIDAIAGQRVLLVAPPVPIEGADGAFLAPVAFPSASVSSLSTS